MSKKPKIAPDQGFFFGSNQDDQKRVVGYDMANNFKPLNAFVEQDTEKPAVNSPEAEKWAKIEALTALNGYLSYGQRARVLNLSRMTELHPEAPQHNLGGNQYKADGILDDAERYLRAACAHCALSGTESCLISSKAKAYTAKHPTQESRQDLIDENELDPETSC